MSHQPIKGFEILTPSRYETGSALSIRERPPVSADGKPPPPLPRRVRSLLLAKEEHIKFVQEFFWLISDLSFSPLSRKEEFIEQFIGGWTERLLQQLQQLSHNVDASEPSQPELQSFPLAFVAKFVPYVVDKAVLAGFHNSHEVDEHLKPFLQKWEGSGKTGGTISNLNTVEKRRRSSRKLFQCTAACAEFLGGSAHTIPLFNDGWYTENDIEAIRQHLASNSIAIQHHACNRLLDPSNLMPVLLWPLLWPLSDTFELYPVVGGTKAQQRLRELHRNATAEIHEMKPTADNPTGKSEDYPEGRNYSECAMFVTAAIVYLKSEVLAAQSPFDLFSSTVDTKTGDPQLLRLAGKGTGFLPDNVELPSLALSYSSGEVEVAVSKSNAVVSWPSNKGLIFRGKLTSRKERYTWLSIQSFKTSQELCRDLVDMANSESGRYT
ncbi:hypothetical protein G3M48_004638 [Beauveria asiatica]|uniref:HNH nuclease domain-containing protein n=1 Tax=Beauveria asiatica TaxID=1069075 RepID=A0AAW0RT25_9HYPO